LFSSLHKAATTGNLNRVRAHLERGDDTCRPDKNGYTPLDLACQNGHLKVVQLLLSKGASVNSSVGSVTPLLCAVSAGHLDIVKLLLRSGANVNGGKNSQQTPLHTAVKKSNAAMASLLLAKGANLSFRDADGRTPLHYAVDASSSEIAALLLDKGADVNAGDYSGKTPLHTAGTKFRERARAALEIAQMAGSMLGSVGGSTAMSDCTHRLCGPELIAAAQMVRLLASKGADLHARDSAGRIPFDDQTRFEEMILGADNIEEACASLLNSMQSLSSTLASVQKFLK
jgi:hypothetical protein